MRYRLRTLLILVAVLPPLIWGGWAACHVIVAHLVEEDDLPHYGLGATAVEHPDLDGWDEPDFSGSGFLPVTPPQ